MRLITLGTGTVVPDPERASACHWIEDASTRLLVDCGAGALQSLARSRLPWEAIDHLVLSHFHADHIAEIPSLLFAMQHGVAEPRTRTLVVWGPEGSQQLFDAWAIAHGSWITDPGFEVRIEELQPGGRAAAGTLSLEVTGTPHTEESIALRLEGDGRVMGYTGDTGPSEALAEFFRDVDLLLAECSLPDDMAADNHLSPASLATLARAAHVERLAVTHVYPQLRRNDVAALIRRAGFDGDIIMMEDGTELQV